MAEYSDHSRLLPNAANLANIEEYSRSNIAGCGEDSGHIKKMMNIQILTENNKYVPNIVEGYTYCKRNSKYSDSRRTWRMKRI